MQSSSTESGRARALISPATRPGHRPPKSPKDVKLLVAYLIVGAALVMGIRPEMTVNLAQAEPVAQPIVAVR